MQKGASICVLTESDRVEIRLSGLVKPTTGAKLVCKLTPPHRNERAGEWKTVKNAEKGSKTKASGGEGGIRTPDGLAPMPHFECGAFNHSATSPRGRLALVQRGRFIAAVSAAGKGLR